MKKQFFKIIGLLAVCGLAFASCQEEDEITAEVDQPQNIIYKEYSYQEVHPNYVEKPARKFGLPMLPSTITDIVPTYYGLSAVEYNTKKIGSQEWMTEYWNNPYVDGVINGEAGAFESPNYPEDGQYYEWSVLTGTTQTTWDDVFKYDHGFHLPSVADIEALVDYLGSTAYLASQLELSPYNEYWAGSPWNTFTSSGNLGTAIFFWVKDPEHVINRVPGCGVFLKIKNGSVSYVCTNMPTIGIRSIVMRNVN